MGRSNDKRMYSVKSIWCKYTQNYMYLLYPTRYPFFTGSMKHEEGKDLWPHGGELNWPTMKFIHLYMHNPIVTNPIVVHRKYPKVHQEYVTRGRSSFKRRLHYLVVMTCDNWISVCMASVIVICIMVDLFKMIFWDFIYKWHLAPVWDHIWRSWELGFWYFSAD